MANSEEAKNCKPEVTSSSPPQEQQQQQQQQTSHVYPDWGAMQAYYGPRMAIPPYFNSTAASGHTPPPYMWGPLQHMMPPYAAIYPQGVYAHPGVTVAASPMHVDSLAKSSGNSDRGLIKKLKGFDGLAMSIGNENGISHSGETEGSSEGSDGNTTEGAKSGQKRSCGGSSTSSEIGKTDDQLPSTNGNGSLKKVKTITVATPNVTMFQNERELKRERRKQSNRESARRSRLRKQAEAEELGTRVESLTSENLTLKSEINRLTVNSSNLKLQNAKLMEKLKKSQIEQDTEDPRPDKKGLSLSTANLLSKVDTASDTGIDTDTGGTGATLRQLLGASPRADAVAAG
ncbi:unnamed protein product [Lactuca saligna]|uniref:BZIP domain-containing protein n=1 Tax=Lactuca saligna TaxID=75948 RepID=A0AA35YRU5_LACSI|nr:unnamed protein product [Lactuca saligna]